MNFAAWALSSVTYDVDKPVSPIVDRPLHMLTHLVSPC